MSKATINLQLSYEEAQTLAEFLPQRTMCSYDDDESLMSIRETLCEILGLKSHDL